MSNFRKRIADKLSDFEYRHSFFAGRLLDEIANAIIEIREKRNITQEELARRTGMHQSAISRLEKASYGKWSIPTLLRVAKGLDARVEVRLTPMEEVIEGYSGANKNIGSTQDIPFLDLPLPPENEFKRANNPIETNSLSAGV